MKANISNFDRTVRVLLAAGLAYLVFSGYLTNGWAIAGLALAGILISTSLVKFCPLYLPLKINTRTKRHRIAQE